jgi:LPS sulfotransferase NodH
MKYSFIVVASMPRSGSTWIGKVFDSHPGTIYRHEPDSNGRLKHVPFAPGAHEYKSSAQPVQRFFEQLPRMRAVKVYAKRPVFAKTWQPASDALLRQFTVALANLGTRFMGGIEIPQPRVPDDVTKWPVVYKTIESVTRLGLFAHAIPNACFVHIFRHPCGFVASVLRGEKTRRFSSAESAAEDYGLFELLLKTEQAQRYGLSIRILQDLHPVERLAWKWVVSNEKALSDSRGVTRYKAIRYEDICADPIGLSGAMFEHAGLDWNAQTERFVSQSTSREIPSYYSVFKDPVQAADRWRKELAPADARRVMGVVEQSIAGKMYFESGIGLQQRPSDSPGRSSPLLDYSVFGGDRDRNNREAVFTR